MGDTEKKNTLSDADREAYVLALAFEQEQYLAEVRAEVRAARAEGCAEGFLETYLERNLTNFEIVLDALVDFIVSTYDYRKVSAKDLVNEKAIEVLNSMVKERTNSELYKQIKEMIGSEEREKERTELLSKYINRKRDAGIFDEQIARELYTLFDIYSRDASEYMGNASSDRIKTFLAESNEYSRMLEDLSATYKSEGETKREKELISKFVNRKHDSGMPNDQIKQELILTFDLSEKEAEKYVIASINEQ